MAVHDWVNTGDEATMEMAEPSHTTDLAMPTWDSQEFEAGEDRSGTAGVPVAIGYRAVYRDFPAPVEVRDDISELMVSFGRLLIPADAAF